MIDKQKYENRTDRGWERLHHRLVEDRLIEDRLASEVEMKVTDHRRNMIPMVSWSIAAVVAILFGLGVYTLYFSHNEVEKMNYITQQNVDPYQLVETLQDGSIVYLAKASTLSYPETFAADKREVSLVGEAYFDITKNQARPFYIQTGQVKIKVLGTAFNVKSETADDFKLDVERGIVKVSLGGSSQAVYVKAGQSATLINKRLYLSPTADVTVFDHHKNNIRFKDETLADILRIVNMNAGEGMIHLDSETLTNRKMTVVFSDISPQTVVPLLCAALNLTSRSDGHQFYLSESVVGE